MGGQFALAEKGADSSSTDGQRWLRLAYQARGTAIAGGSTFIQRNIVAERILGMPKD
jgi:alkylation response protein AidB-like acyl-CoA dehydrogenase